MPTKNDAEVRILSGDNIQYKLPSGSWISFGNVKKGGLIGGDTFGNTKIELMKGRVITQITSREVYMQFEMAQTAKAALELLDTLNGKQAEIYAYDGIVGTNHLEFYGKEGTIFLSIDDSKADGNTPQTIKVFIAFEEQASDVSIADTGLPSDSFAATGTYTGNKYRAWIETAVA